MEGNFFAIIAGLLVVLLFFATAMLWLHSGKRFYIGIALYIFAVMLSGPLGVVYILNPEWQPLFIGACLGGAFGSWLFIGSYIKDYSDKAQRPKNVLDGWDGFFRIFFTMMTLLFIACFVYFLL